MSTGGGSTSSTVTQNSLPSYAEPYYKDIMRRTQKESTQPYQPYNKDRIADRATETSNAFGMAEQFANSGTNTGGVVSGLGNIANRASNLSPYAGSNYSADQTGAQQVGWGSDMSRVGAGSFDAAARDRYMSPYMDAVVNRAQENAVDQFQQAQAQRNLQAAKSGSFGGSRAAVGNAIASNAHANNLTDIFVTGQQQAFENAQGQFNADTDRRLQADITNQGTALNFLQGNQNADLESQMANQQANYNAANMNEQSRQFGAQYGLSSLDLARTANMDQLSALGQQDQMMQDRIQAMLGVGQSKEEYKQKKLDQRYSDFVNQRDAERQNIAFYSGIMNSMPVSPNRDVMTTTPQNNLAGIVSAYGGMNAMNGLKTS